MLETPKVNPADALMPGLLKLKPEVLDVPNPDKEREFKMQAVTILNFFHRQELLGI